MYEHFEHTADLGLRVRAADLNGLFAEAARGLFAMMVENLVDVRPMQTATFEISGQDHEYLLFDWLNELLFTFDKQKLVLSEFDVCVNEDGLTATTRGEPLDPARHQLSHEVKAITYHQLIVEEQSDGWFAELIVDI